MAAFKFKGMNATALTPAPIPAPRVLPKGLATERAVIANARFNEATQTVINAVIDQPEPIEIRPPESVPEGETVQEREQRLLNSRKLSKLVDEDFPFDPSQIDAINGLAKQQYGCLTGAAGTGKTTCTKAIVDKLLDSALVGEVDMTTYFKKGVTQDEDDDYEMPTSFVPSVCICAFTGQASQMVKKNFPRDWHGNIMTIHRMLAFAPDFYEEFDPEIGEMRNKMRFSPTYNQWNKMPWDIVLIDEAGMTSLDLWKQVSVALKPGARIIMIGDINQLPPVHGRSVFGFAMTHWPSWELTEIHRQVGVNNSIVDNAWRILQGRSPISEAPAEARLNLMDKESIIRTLNWMVTNQDWKTLTLMIPDESAKASRHIRLMLKKLQDRMYDPIRDSVITAINGHDGSNGRVLGQIPMNMELAIALNQVGTRYIIDAGRERKNFGIGEKVMNTKNDHEAGVTNGMTGLIKSIERNGAYSGDTLRFDTVENVAAYMADLPTHELEADFSLDDISESIAAQNEGKKAAAEARDRGPASHIVTVTFGTGDTAFDLHFATLSEVASLMTAYVVTCHKMQGSECPHIFLICHSAHKQMLYREWLYTGWTRASQKIILLYTPHGLRQALNKQRIKGKNLKEKVLAFQALQKDYGVGPAVKVSLPDPLDITTGLSPEMPQDRLANVPAKIEDTSAPVVIESVKPVQFAPRPRVNTTRPEVRERIIERVIERTIFVHRPAPVSHPTHKAEPVDGGDLKAYEAEWDKTRREGMSQIDKLMAAARGTARLATPVERLALPAPVKLQSQFGAVAMLHRIEDMQRVPLLTYQPVPVVKPGAKLGAFKRRV